MNVRYHVELSKAERCELTALVLGSGKHYAPQGIKRAQILLGGRQAGSATKILPLLWLLSAARTVYRTKRRFVKGPISKPPCNEEPRAEGADRKLTSNEEALLIATACSEAYRPKVAPAGRWSCWLARWSS